METYDKPRNSNLELLRIIAMLFIVSFHLSRHGFDGVDFLLSNPNSYFLYFLGILGKLGVDIFIIISAYFMIKSKFTFRKLMLLVGDVYFYSTIFLVIFTIYLTPVNPITPIDLLKCVLPISHEAYWFITNYITLMLLSPFLNMCILKLSKRTFLKLLTLVLVLWVVYPTFTGTSFAYSEMIFFIILYMIGSFIRLHLNLEKINMKKLILVFSVSLIMTYLLFMIFGSIEPLNQISIFNKETSMFKASNSLFILISAVTIFLIFIKRKEFSNKYINYISGSVLGVYLIHSNQFVWPYLFNKFLHVQTYINSPHLIISSIIFILAIYIICTGIDILRRLTIEKLWIYIVDNKLNGIPQWIDRKYEVFEKRISYYLK